MTHKIDTSSPQAWGNSLIELGRLVAEGGLQAVGLCDDDLEDFLCDTWVGDVPWTAPKCWQVMEAVFAHPDYERVEAAFMFRFGDQCEGWAGTRLDYWAGEIFCCRAKPDDVPEVLRSAAYDKAMIMLDEANGAPREKRAATAIGSA